MTAISPLRRFLVAVAVLLAAVVPSAAVVMGDAAPASAGVTVSGTGSSYAAIAINAWVSQVYTALGLNVNYQSSSSVIGLENFAQGLVDFGASEIGYDAGQTQTPPPGDYQYLPSVAGATCLMYNVLGQTGQQVQQLQLTPAVIAGIFTGTIRKWNDPAVAALNPSALLPNAPIVATFRSDASGDNYIFSDYLQTLEPSTWAAFTGAMGARNGPTAVWPTPANGGTSAGQFNESNWVAQNGSDNASNYVASSLNTITYVETGYASEHNMPCAYIQNTAGSYIRPSELGDAYALVSDQVNLTTGEQSLGAVFTSPNPNAYPISAYSYLTSLKGTLPANKGAVLSAFVLFLACQGQQSAATLGYSPLPTNLVQADFNAISNMNGHVPLPAAINAQTCPNPYITGQLQSVGEPPILGAPSGSYSGTVTVGGGGGSGGAGAATAASAANAGTGGAAAVLKPKAGAGGTITAGGQTPGVALLAASNQLLGIPGPTWTMILWTLGFLAVLGIPMVLFALSASKSGDGIAARVRRVGSSAGAETEDETDA